MLKQVEEAFEKRLQHIYDAVESKEIFLLCAEEVLQFSRNTILLQKNRELSDEEETRFHQLLDALETGKPVQYALGYAWFYGMKLLVNDKVLIPRPETEELVSLILSEYRNLAPTVLDIGTGSGCIPLAIKKNLANAQVIGLDISSEALQVAEINAEKEQLTVRFVQADILSKISPFPTQKFDVVVSNPPYITPSEQSAMAENVLHHEPHLALFIPEEKPLLFYKAIAHFAKKHLRPGGKLYFEINRRFGQELKDHLESVGFKDVFIFKDMHGADRMMSAKI